MSPAATAGEDEVGARSCEASELMPSCCAPTPQRHAAKSLAAWSSGRVIILQTARAGHCICLVLIRLVQDYCTQKALHQAIAQLPSMSLELVDWHTHRTLPTVEATGYAF